MALKGSCLKMTMNDYQLIYFTFPLQFWWNTNLWSCYQHRKWGVFVNYHIPRRISTNQKVDWATKKTWSQIGRKQIFIHTSSTHACRGRHLDLADRRKASLPLRATQNAAGEGLPASESGASISDFLPTYTQGKRISVTGGGRNGQDMIFWYSGTWSHWNYSFFMYYFGNWRITDLIYSGINGPLPQAADLSLIWHSMLKKDHGNLVTGWAMCTH